jgi:hypothetical protein
MLLARWRNVSVVSIDQAVAEQYFRSFGTLKKVVQVKVEDQFETRFVTFVLCICEKAKN